MADLKKQFDAAAKQVLDAKQDPGNDMKLKLYAHYKQATDGDVAGDKPGFTDFVNRAKYEAWAKLKGLSKDEAMAAYIKLVDRDPGLSVPEFLVEREAAPAIGTSERETALPLRDLETAFRRISFLTRWIAQLRERIARLAT